MFIQQIYDAYTDTEHLMWHKLYCRQLTILNSRAAAGFMDGLTKLKMLNSRIPNYDILSNTLSELTGWRLVGVTGIVPNAVFFQLLAERRFPVTTWIRKPEQMDYLEEPDLFHDVFGHIPLLADSAYADFLEAIGKIGLQYIDNALAIELLSRIYWFTIEFGLMAEQQEIKIYGAGILSSPGEAIFSLSARPPKAYFNIQELFHTPYIKHRMQDRYFVIHNFAELYNSIGAIADLLDKELSLAKHFEHNLEDYGFVVPQEFIETLAK